MAWTFHLTYCYLTVNHCFQNFINLSGSLISAFQTVISVSQALSLQSHLPLLSVRKLSKVLHKTHVNNFIPLYLHTPLSCWHCPDLAGCLCWTGMVQRTRLQCPPSSANPAESNPNSRLASLPSFVPNPPLVWGPVCPRNLSGITRHRL